MFFLLFAIGFSVFADTLNTRTAADCLRQVRLFTDDYSSYFKLRVEITGVSGRVYDTDQITIRLDNGEMFFQILYSNEVFLRIWLEKASTKYDDTYDGIAFAYAQSVGFTTRYLKTYTGNNKFEVPYIFINIFEALGL
jgi:hypothetical protein